MPSTLPTDLQYTFILAQTGQASPSEQMMTGSAGSSTPATTSTGTATTPSAGAAPAGSAPPNQSPASGISFLPLMLIALAVLIIPTLLSSRRDKKKRETLMANMGKGDKVLTIAGQIGWVDQIKDSEVVLRFDENSNVKGRFTKAAIQQILESKSAPAPDTVDNTPSIEVKAKSEKSAVTR